MNRRISKQHTLVDVSGRESLKLGVRGSRAEACQAMDREIRTIEKQVNAVDEIEKWTSTIQSNSGRILERTELVRDALRSSIATLDARVEYVRTDDE